MEQALTDSLIVVNGPEDGTAHALIRTRVTIGARRDCDIVLVQDDEVRDRHAEVFATRRGFRLRCLPGAPARVNGKRSGRVGSRLLRDGDIVEFGHTELMMQSLDADRLSEAWGEGNRQTAKVGIGRRALEGVFLFLSALWYGVADTVHTVFAVAGKMVTVAARRRRLAFRLSLLACAIGAYAFLPGIRHLIDAALYAVTEYFRFAAESISQLTGR